MTEIFLNSRITSINGFYRYGWTPLVSALSSGNVDLVSYLIDKGADINQKTNTHPVEIFPILQSVRGNDTQMIELLVSRGADVRSKASDGYTVLHKACQYNLKNVVNFVIGKGADLCAQTNDGSTPLILFDIDNIECHCGLISFIKELARLHFENKWIPACDINWIRDNPVVKSYFVECTAELEVMLTTKF